MLIYWTLSYNKKNTHYFFLKKIGKEIEDILAKN